jgi:hypothetical protein
MFLAVTRQCVHIRDFIFVVVFPFLCLALLFVAGLIAKRSIKTLSQWRQRTLGTSIILASVAWVASLICVISATTRRGGETVMPSILICSLMCPAAILLALVSRGKSCLFLVLAEMVQDVWLLAVFGSGGVL